MYYNQYLITFTFLARLISRRDQMLDEPLFEIVWIEPRLQNVTVSRYQRESPANFCHAIIEPGLRFVVLFVTVILDSNKLNVLWNRCISIK